MAFSLDKSVVLVGMPGAGKSTVGRHLADRFGVEFVDCDDAVEETQGLKVAEIFARFGEAHFRACERQAMNRLIEGPPRVIATGGGGFLDPNTRQRVLEECIAIWLDADIEILAGRISGLDDRPMLKGGDVVAQLADLSEQRHPFYAEAQVRIPTSALPVEAVVDRIAEAVGEAPA